MSPTSINSEKEPVVSGENMNILMFPQRRYLPYSFSTNYVVWSIIQPLLFQMHNWCILKNKYQVKEVQSGEMNISQVSRRRSSAPPRHKWQNQGWKAFREAL